MEHIIGSNPGASMTSVRLRVNRSVNQSVQSIRDGYHHSRRTKQLYPVHDLPRRPSVANYAVMLGSLSSVKNLEENRPRTCFWDWGAPTVEAIRSRVGCVFITAIAWNTIYSGIYLSKW